MEHEQIHPHAHKHVALWLGIGLIATLVLFFMAYNAKNERNFQLIPIAEKPTPTPIATSNFTVNEPQAQEHVSQVFIVTGTTKVPVIGIRLREKYSGHVITEVRANSSNPTPGEPGEYGAELRITSDTIRSESPLLLDVFEATQTEEKNKITLPLTFTPVGS